MSIEQAKNAIARRLIQDIENSDDENVVDMSDDMARRVIKYSIGREKYRALKTAFNNLEGFPKDLTLKEQIALYNLVGGETEE